MSFPTRAGGAPVLLPLLDFQRVKGAGQCVYCVHYDLIHDIEKKGLNILQLFRELAESGEVLDCALDFEAAGTLDGPIGNQLPLRLIFSTTTAPGGNGNGNGGRKTKPVPGEAAHRRA